MVDDEAVVVLEVVVGALVVDELESSSLLQPVTPRSRHGREDDAESGEPAPTGEGGHGLQLPVRTRWKSRWCRAPTWDVLSRRNFLGLAGGVVILAACGGGDDDDSAGSTLSAHDHGEGELTDRWRRP